LFRLLYNSFLFSLKLEDGMKLFLEEVLYT